jgi:hypothetical protein
MAMDGRSSWTLAVALGSTSRHIGEVLVGLALLVAMLSLFEVWIRSRNRRKGRARILRRVEMFGTGTYFRVGIVIGGLWGVSYVDAICAVDRDDLVFIPAFTDGRNPGNPGQPAPELGRIPRTAVRGLRVSDHWKTQQEVYRRPGFVRSALFGASSIASPGRANAYMNSKVTRFNLTIDWRDGNDVGQATTLEFSTYDEAIGTENIIRESLQPREPLWAADPRLPIDPSG